MRRIEQLVDGPCLKLSFSFPSSKGKDLINQELVKICLEENEMAIYEVVIARLLRSLSL